MNSPLPKPGRIGELCWYKKAPDALYQEGELLAWSLDSERGDIIGQYPAAIVLDLESLIVNCVPAVYLSFSKEPPWIREEAKK